MQTERKIARAKRATMGMSPRAMARRAAYMYVFGDPEMRQLSATNKERAKEIIRKIVNADITTSLETVRKEVVKQMAASPKSVKMLSPESLRVEPKQRVKRAHRSASSGVDDLIDRIKAVRIVSPKQTQAAKKQRANTPSWERGLIAQMSRVQLQAPTQPVDALTQQLQAMALQPTTRRSQHDARMRASEEDALVRQFTQGIALTNARPKKSKKVSTQKKRTVVFGPAPLTSRLLDLRKRKEDEARKAQESKARIKESQRRKREARKAKKDALDALALFKLGGKPKRK